MAIQAESAELATVVEETVSGIRVVKGFGSESVQSAKLRAEADDVYGSVDGRDTGARLATCPRWTCCRTSACSPCSATAATSCSTAT